MERSPSTELAFVKLGGSIITDKQRPSTPRPELIERLGAEVKAALDARSSLRVLLGHGSGSFGHVVGARYRVRQGIADEQSWWGYAATGAAAGQLNRIVTDTFLAVGVPVVALQPSASVRCRSGRLVEMDVRPVSDVLRHGLVPLIYGDVALDEEQGCTIVSTEQLFAYLAHHLRPVRLIMVGEVDGVYTDDPLGNTGASRIRCITPATFDGLQARLGGSHGLDVTGGMLSKVREMVNLVARGHTQRVHLISGQRAGALQRALLDVVCDEGTLIEPDADTVRPRTFCVR
jgi:isopentenyl phosphate kinase